MRTRYALLLTLSATTSILAEDKVTYADHARAAMENKCFSCHNPDKKKGDLDLTSYGALMAGGGGGSVVDPGNPDSSKLLLVCLKKEEPFMPPEGPGLSPAELDVLKKWITGGVLDTASSVAKKSNKPKIDLNVASGTGKPEGPIAKPEHVLLEPVVVTPRTTAVTALAASPWTGLVAVAAPKQILLYDTDTRQLAGIFPYTEGYARTLKFSTSGSLLALGGGRGGKFGHAVVFDVKTGKRVAEVGKEPDSVMSADISPDHSKVVIGCTGKKVKCYDLASGEELYTIAKHTEWILGTDFSPDGILLATCDRNGNVFVWEADNGGEFFLLGQHKDTPCVDIAWRADSNVLASIGKDGNVILWEMNEGKQLKTWRAHDSGAEAVSFTPDGNIVTCGASGSVKLWDVNGNAKGKLDGAGHIATDVVALHDSKTAVFADWSGAVKKVSLEGSFPILGELSSNPSQITQRILQNEQRAAELSTKIKPAQDAAAAAEAAAKAKADALAKLKAEAGSAEGRKNALPGEIKATTDQLAQTKANKEKLNKDRETRKTQLAQFAEKQKALSALEAQLPPVAAEAAKLPTAEKALADAKAAAETVKKELAAKAGDPALTAKLKETEAKLPALTAEVTKLTPQRDKANQLTAQINQAKQALGAQPGALTEFDKPISEADAQLKTLAETLAAKNKELPGITEALKAYPNRIKDSEKQLADAQAAAAKAQADAKSLADDLAIAQRQVPSLKAAQFNVGVLTEKEKLEKLESDFQAYTDGLKENEDAKAAALKLIEDSKKNIADATTAQPALDAAFQQQAKELEPVEKIANTSKAAQDAAAAKVNEKKSAISSVDGKIATLIKEKEAAVAAANKVEAEIDKQVQAHKPVLATAEQKAAGPKKNVEDKKAELAKLETEWKAAQSAAAAAKTAFDQKTTEATAKQKLVTSTQMERDNSQKAVAPKRQAYDRAAGQLNGIKAATANKEKALAEAKAANKPEAANLEKELTEHKAKATAAESELTVLKGLADAAAADYEAKKKAHNEAGTAHQAAKNEAGKANSALVQANNQNKAKEGQVSAAKAAIATAEKQAAPLLAAVKTAYDKLEGARAARQEKRDLPAKLEQELAAKKAPLEAEGTKLKAELPPLEKTLADATAVATKDLQARDAKRELVGKAQAAAEAGKKKKADAESAIASATKDIPQREKNIAEAKAALAQLQPQLDPLRGKVKQLTEQYLAMLPK